MVKVLLEMTMTGRRFCEERSVKGIGMRRISPCSGPINAYQSVTFYPLPGAVAGFQGPATIECTNGRRIAAIVNTVGTGTGDLTMTFNGINR